MKDLVIIVMACLESNLSLAEMVKEIQNETNCSFLESYDITKDIIKELARDNDYLAIVRCYQMQMPY